MNQEKEYDLKKENRKIVVFLVIEIIVIIFSFWILPVTIDILVKKELDHRSLSFNSTYLTEKFDTLLVIELTILLVLTNPIATLITINLCSKRLKEIILFFNYCFAGVIACFIVLMILTVVVLTGLWERHKSPFKNDVLLGVLTMMVYGVLLFYFKIHIIQSINICLSDLVF